MRNSEIIMRNTCLLIMEGKLPEDATLHTYAMWQTLGYKVKKGEKAVAKFPIWKYTTTKKKKEEETDEEEAGRNERCFMKLSAFFSNAQVERIKKEA